MNWWNTSPVTGKVCVCAVPASASWDPLHRHHRVSVLTDYTGGWRKKWLWGFWMLSCTASKRQKTGGVKHYFVPSVVGQRLSSPMSHHLFPMAMWIYEHWLSSVAFLFKCIYFIHFEFKHRMCPSTRLGRLGLRKAAVMHCFLFFSSGEFQQLAYVHVLH